MSKVTRPDVSVVIPFLNAAPYLRQAVESVFRQTFKGWELLLVDGGSIDGSQHQARALSRRHPGRVRVLKGPRSSILRKRMLGAKRARAPLVALLDSDDQWQPDLLERRVAEYRRNFGSGAGLVFGPAIYWWEGPRAARRVALQPMVREGLYRPPSLLPEFLESGYIKTPNPTGSLMARQILLEASRYSSSVGLNMVEDIYLWSDVALRYPIYASARPLFWYRQRADSTSAQGKARGEFQDLRREHLRWLFGYVLKNKPVG